MLNSLSETVIKIKCIIPGQVLLMMKKGSYYFMSLKKNNNNKKSAPTDGPETCRLERAEPKNIHSRTVSFFWWDAPFFVLVNAIYSFLLPKKKKNIRNAMACAAVSVVSWNPDQNSYCHRHIENSSSGPESTRSIRAMHPICSPTKIQRPKNKTKIFGQRREIKKYRVEYGAPKKKNPSTTNKTKNMYIKIIW